MVDERIEAVKASPTANKIIGFANKNLRETAVFVTQVATIGGALGAIGGLSVIGGYLGRVSTVWNNAPLANGDMYAATLLPTLFVVVGFFGLFVFGAAAYPALLRNISNLGLISLFSPRPEVFGPYPPIDMRSKVNSYLILHLPVVLAILAMLAQDVFPSANYYWIAIAFLLGQIATLVCLRRRGRDISVVQVIYLAAFGLVYIFMLSIFVLVVSALLKSTGADDKFATGIALLLFLYIDFAFFAAVMPTQQTVLVLIVMLGALAGTTIGPAPLGAMALRAVGIGGGMPVSALIRVLPTETPAIVRGCLVANFGGHFIVEEFRPGEVSGRDCAYLHLQGGDRKNLPPSFCRLSVYWRADVIRISSVDAVHQSPPLVRDPVTQCDVRPVSSAEN